MYSSGGLDDEQVYDHDSVKKNYRMWKPSQKGGIGNEREKERKRIIVALRVV